MDVRKHGGDAELGGCCVAAWIRDTGCFGDEGAVDEFGETVGPVGGEPVVGGEVDDDAFGAAFVDCVDPGFGDAVGEGHDPDIDSFFVCELADVFCGEVFVDYLLLVVSC